MLTTATSSFAIAVPIDRVSMRFHDSCGKQRIGHAVGGVVLSVRQQMRGDALSKLGRRWWTIFRFWDAGDSDLSRFGVMGEVENEEEEDEAVAAFGGWLCASGTEVRDAGMAIEDDMIAGHKAGSCSRFELRCLRD